MKFAKIVYRMAAIYGFLVLTPLYFLLDRFGKDAPPPITHPELYYGFVGLAMVWQFAFLLIASDPERYRPLMLITILEKLVYSVPCVSLYMRGAITGAALAPSLVDPILGALFVTAYVKTEPMALARTQTGKQAAAAHPFV